jgi:hypothetical protein
VEQLCTAAQRLSVLCGARAEQSADLATQVTILLLQTLHDDLADDGYVEQHSVMQAVIEVCLLWSGSEFNCNLQMYRFGRCAKTAC